MEAIIEVKNLSYSYAEGGKSALNGVSFSVLPGEFLCVLGHNGSGKSTLAKLLNGLFRPASGWVKVGGVSTADEDKIWELRRQCGEVFQNPDNQLIATVVLEDVAFGLENLGVPSEEIEPRARAALKAVGMEAFAQSAPHLLSGGQKQRVAIAGVLAMSPRVIVFDEATAMLDPVGRRDVMEVVRRLNREEGITVVWITHFMEEAAGADRILVMNDGKIAMEGAPRALFRRGEELREIGLDVPEMTALAGKLRADGIELDEGILSVEEMVVALCRLK